MDATEQASTWVPDREHPHGMMMPKREIYRAHGCHELTIKEQWCLEQHANATSDREDVQFGDVLAVEKDGVSRWFP